MANTKTQKMKQVLVAGVLTLAMSAEAQQMLPTDTEAAQLSDAIAQTTGEFDSVNLGYIHSLGMQQKAWNDPLAHMGEGQIKPGYSRYNWSPDVVLPIRLREGMMTLINLPAWELIEKVHIGSPESFGGEIAAPNSLLLYADPSYIGVDSNMIVFGRSGNRYIFYLRSETYNTDKITQSVVDVLVGPRFTPVSAGGSLGDYNGATATMSSTAGSSFAPGWASGRGSLTPGGAQNPTGGLNTASTGPADWLKTIPVDPESFHFDIDMYLPNPDDVDIAPDNVWRDNIFTYIDLGPKALTMTQRPVVNLIVQDSEVPVGFRTRGPNSRLIVVEGIGDMVLRNGKKIICLKLRRDPATGLESIDYSGSNARPETWNAPAMMGSNEIAARQGGGNMGQTNVDAMLMRRQVPMTMDGEPIAVNESAMFVENDSYGAGYASSGYGPGDNMPQEQVDEEAAYRAVVESQQMVPMQAIPTAVRRSPQAASGIVGVMEQIAVPAQGGTGYAQSSSTNNRLRMVAPSETISIELGSHASIAELEALWERAYSENEAILKGFEPYYSVDTTADGDVRELFRLRVGPISDVQAADALCRKLGRRGFSCAVIRVQ